MMMRKTAILLALALLLALPASAGRKSIDRTVSASPDGEVSIEILAGTISVVAWERAEVRISGTIDDDHEELEIDVEGDEISIEVDFRDGEHKNTGRGAEIEVMVPSGSRVEVEAISADITIEGVRGAVGVEAVSGNLKARGAMEEIDFECVSGDVSVETSGALRRASVETVSGDIDLRGALSSRARVDLESVNGDITLRLPRSTSAQFDIETFSGDIKNDFGPQARKSSDMLPAKELSFSLGSGDARVTIEAFNGTVKLIEE
jgi:DUF4097 and DUF4098 domain-containing protein YvlB